MNPPEEAIIRSMKRVMQIIAAALMTGIASSLVIALLALQDLPSPHLPFVCVFAALLLCLNSPLGFIVPRTLLQNKLRALANGVERINGGDPSLIRELLTIRQTGLIISRALLEAAAITGLVGFMVEGHHLVLAIPG